MVDADLASCFRPAACSMTAARPQSGKHPAVPDVARLASLDTRRASRMAMPDDACNAGKDIEVQADYVIVGAGSAGCVLANRLSEDPATRVVLIEAGGRDWNPLIHIPVGFMKLLDHPTLTWGFKAEADPGTAGRAIAYPRGRVLGGSSSINGLIYIRGQPEDFDHWAQLGNRGWGWDDVLPYFKQAENWQGEASELHGTGGFLTTSPMSERPAACQAIIDAGRRARRRIPPGRQQPAAGRRRQHRLVPADPRRAAPRQRRAHLSEAGVKAAQPADRHQGAGAPRARSTASARSGSCYSRGGRERRSIGRCGARGDPRRRRDRLAASPAIVGRRRARASRQGRHPGAPRASRRRAQFPGPLHRPHVVRGARHRNLERTRPRPLASPTSCGAMSPRAPAC